MTGIRAGSSAALGGWFDDQLAVERYNNRDGLDIAALEMLAGVIALSLYLLHRASREYLWFFLAYALITADGALFYAAPGRLWSQAWASLLSYLLVCASWIAYLLFYKHLLAGRAGWLFRLAVAGLAAIYLLFFLS